MKDRFDKFIVDSNFIFRALANNSRDYIYIWDLIHGYYCVSPNFAEEFELESEGEDFLAVWDSFIHSNDLERVKETIEIAIQLKESAITIEYQVTNAQEYCIWICDRATVSYNAASGDPELLVGVIHNLALDGEVDSITGLLLHGNGKDMYDLRQSSMVGHSGALMLLGIDEFTSINTLNSHSFGDLVLRTTVQDLLKLLPDNMLMYRHDGDQLLIVGDQATKDDMLRVYYAIKAYTTFPHEIEGKSYRFTVSAGLAAYPSDGVMWEDLERAVSIALKEAKAIGKNHCVEFTNKMLTEKIYTQSLLGHLADGIEHEFLGFKVVFQPVSYVQNLRIKGAEILLRYVTPEGVVVRPDYFIHLLEQSQLIIPVGMWVLEKAMQTCKRWIKHMDDFVMNVNVSYIQLRDISFCDKIEALLEKYDFDVKNLTLELTESYFITDAPNINASLKRLRELKIPIAMDDFGTGYSSLARLSQFNVDVVKIDRTLVQSLHKSKYNYDFVESVVRICHNVGMKVCVEGVETKEEQESVCILNADFVQGYYVSKPIEEEEFFTRFIMDSEANADLVVIPNVQRRHEQLVSDKDVLTVMMDATPLGVVFWNQKMEIMACNRVAQTLFESKNFRDFRENFFSFSPEYQPDGEKSTEKLDEKIQQAFSGKKVNMYWDHCNRNGEMIPTEITIVRIPYKDEYIAASYTRICVNRSY